MWKNATIPIAIGRVSKVGFYYLQKTDNEQFSSELCLIIDESIRVGTEKLLLILACPMDKVDSGNISSEDVRVVGLEGSTKLERSRNCSGY